MAFQCLVYSCEDVVFGAMATTLSTHGVNPKVAIQNSSDDRPGNGNSGVLDSLYCSQPFPPSLDF